MPTCSQCKMEIPADGRQCPYCRAATPKGCSGALKLALFILVVAFLLTKFLH